ncbi:cell division protein ZapE [Aureimonas endophytica]|uniref:Cell division protein ZapE n=1 Tax=Aureimonas endophytica TaxID=2027858 RepID=A0A916ZNJ9_9HYPH|nr:cell division protein ZapE [Aureimonas endophytica]GGE06456.1 cell division protein ZapE [Aureimonas endophytica]
MTASLPPAKSRPGSVRQSLERLIASGEIEPDANQRLLADRLDRLDKDLSAATLAAKGSALGWLFGRAKAPQPVRGVYIHGAVGRGKTMLMDIFFRHASAAPKRRLHFHAFMGEVHERIGEHRKALREGRVQASDPIPPVAKALAEKAKLLCFDEFTVTDVADAMILRRLFEQLFAEGVALVATSNVAPDDLYRDGLKRGDFLPFIEILKSHVDVVKVDGPQDYRLASVGEAAFYVTPLGPETERAMDETFRTLLAGEKPRPASLSVKGRTVPVPAAGNGVARFAFQDLVGRPLGAEDFLAIAARFHTVVIDGVTRMGPAERNEAKRFITLIDALYDAGRRVVISADGPVEALYSGRQGAEAFEFQRTVSRLIEMRSGDYGLREAGGSSPT